MSPEAAKDEMLAVFKAMWDPTGYTAAYPDVPAIPPPTDAPWARITVRHELGGQTSLSNAAGAKKWTHVGTLFVQLFTPIGQGGTVGLQLVKPVLDAYRNARGVVWYRNHRFREIGNDGAFNQINCMVDFTYDDS